MSHAHSQRATVALQKLAEFDPAFASLSLWANHRDTDGDDVMVASISETGDIQAHRKKVEFAPAYTDGRTIYYGTQFGKWQTEAQMAVAAHEISHISFRHVNRGKALYQRLGPAYDPEIFNIATDAIINEMLRLAGYKLPGNCIYLTELLLKVFDEKVTPQDAVGEWDAETLYMRLMSKKQSQGGNGQSGKPSNAGQSGSSGAAQPNPGQDKSDQGKPDQKKPGQGQGNGEDKDDKGQGQSDSPAQRAKDYASEKDFHSDMDTTGTLTPEDAKEDSEWQQRLERALRYGAQAGTGIGKLGHRIADLPKSRTPWELILRRAVTKAVTRLPRPSYMRPARRWIGAEDNARLRGLPTPAYEPGFLKQNMRPRVVIGVDVSGSIGDAVLEIFCGEMASIGNKTGAELHVLVFDTQVLSTQKLDGVDFTSEIKKIDFARGGGTSFIDVLNKAEEIDPSIIVMLTDLEGPFRAEAPKCPIIWASPNQRHPEAPYGRTLSLAA